MTITPIMNDERMMVMFLIKEMPYKERPRERFMAYGKETLKDEELIAILLRTGTKAQGVLSLANQVCGRYPALKMLSQANVEDLTHIHGLGKAKAIQVLAAVELGRRIAQAQFDKPTRLTDPKRVYDYMRHYMESALQEEFHALYLNTKGGLIKSVKLFVGSLASAVVHPREVFKYAVSLSAASMILVHNHPSGDPYPSENDIKLTRLMVENGELMGIEVHDHVIIGHDAYISLRQIGEGFRE